MKIHQFQSYRSWLKAEVAFRLQKNSQFTVSAFAQKIGISQSILSRILLNQRPMSERTAKLLADYLSLNRQEFRYLELLRALDSASNRVDVNRLQREIGELAKNLSTQEKHQSEKRPLSTWEYNALLAATELDSIERSPDSLAQYLGLPLPAVQDGLLLLQNLQLVRLEGGEYRFQQNGVNQLPESVAMQSSRKISAMILEKALAKLSDGSLQNDTIGGMVLATNLERLEQANRRIQEFSKEIEGILRTGAGKKDTLVQFSLQLFDL